MTHPVYSSPALALKDGYVTASYFASMIGKRRQQINMWAKRRKTTGFPEISAWYKNGERTSPLYHLGELQEWKRNYIPHKGGGPRGNKNASWALRSSTR